MKNPMKKGRLDISPSQITTFIDCPRKWWMKHLLGLPEPVREVTRIGDVGHAVIERFLRGEKDLYPDGWHTPRNRWTHEPDGDPISTADQALVKALVHNGVQNGVLVREPDGVIEQEIVLEPAAVPVRIKMFLDYATQHAVMDHKFCGNTRYYGPDKLKLALPMNLYAAAKYIAGEIVEPTVWLRYNLFVKNPLRPQVKPVNVERRQEDILAHFEGVVLPACRAMYALYERTRNAGNPLTDDDWAMVAGPDNPNTCNNYGGCPFQSVCTGQCTVAQYRISMSSSGDEERKEKEKQALARLTGGATEEGGVDMDFRAKVKAMKAAGQSGAATAAPAAATAPVQVPDELPKPAPAAASVTQQQQEQGQQTAPWYAEGCKACSGNPVRGFSTSGKPCAICGMLARKAGHKTPDAYTITVSEDGAISVSLDGEVLMGTEAPAVRSSSDALKPVESAPEQPKPPVEREQSTDEDPCFAGNASDPGEEDGSASPEAAAAPGPGVQPPKRKRRTRAEIEADALAKARAEAAAEIERLEAEKQAALTMAAAAEQGTAASGEAPSVSIRVRDDGEGEDDGLGDLRSESYDFTLSYAPVRMRGRNSRTLGDCNCLVHISELLEMVQRNVSEAEGVEAGTYYEINAFRRRDIIMQNAEVIARAIGGSIVDASCAQRATDEAILCQAIERYAAMVMGQLSA